MVSAIDSMLQDWVTGADAITQRIQNCTALADVYRTYCLQLEGSEVNVARVKNLRASKDRFASYQQPLSRAVLTFDALLNTLVWAITNRDGAEKQRYMRSLRSLGEEVLVLMAMCADIADENLRVLRVIDSEEFDAAEFPQELTFLVDRLHFLINRGGVLETGYTAYMLAYLEQPRGILLGNDARTIGGAARITPALLQRCCEIMQTYVVLALQTMHAEFPDYDLMQAFGVFNLRPACRGDNLDHVVWTERKQKDLDRLSMYAGQDPGRVRAQFCDLEPAARYEQAQTGCSSFEAWKTVALRFQCGKKSVCQRHPVDALFPVLIKYGAYSGATTSGVEQSFSVLQRFQPAERKHMLDATALDEACLMLLPDDPVLRARLCDRAVQIWADHLGAPRERSKVRVDKGIRRGPMVAAPGEPMTETAFIKKRRRDVAGKATSATASEAIEAARLSSYSDGRMEILEEESFQCSKGYTNKIQAYLSNTLLESEIDEDLREAATAAKLHQEDLDKERTRKEDRLAEKLRPKHINVQSQRFHLQDDAWIADPKIARRNCVADLVDARAFVVRDPGNPPDGSLWACMLLGGVLCDLAYCALAVFRL